MKILIVCSGTQGFISPFIKDQTDSLSKLGIDFCFFRINNKGLIGYLLNFISLRRTIKKIKPDLIHAHYGLSGLLANFQRRIPVITTFHGSDINEATVFKFSLLANKFSIFSICVEKSMMQKLVVQDKCILIPCGVDTSVFYPFSKEASSKIMNINSDNLNILFSSGFNIPIKNYTLAKESCKILGTKTSSSINLIELKGYTRAQVSLLINASDCVLLTSFSEGSSQFIKEAMACSCPIVTTTVGDADLVLGNTEGCYLTNFESSVVAEKLEQAIDYRIKHRYTNGRERIFDLGLNSETVAKQIMEVYKKVIYS